MTSFHSDIRDVFCYRNSELADIRYIEAVITINNSDFSVVPVKVDGPGFLVLFAFLLTHSSSLAKNERQVIPDRSKKHKVFSYLTL